MSGATISANLKLAVVPVVTFSLYGLTREQFDTAKAGGGTDEERRVVEKKSTDSSKSDAISAIDALFTNLISVFRCALPTGAALRCSSADYALALHTLHTSGNEAHKAWVDGKHSNLVKDDPSAAGAKEKSGNRTSPWGPAFTVGGIECNCKKCGLVSEAVIANAKWRQFKGELVCPPHCGSSGGQLPVTIAAHRARAAAVGRVWHAGCQVGQH
eukprot:2995-Heterococcus_DN1.PRE.1